MFYNEMFYQDFKSENVFLNSVFSSRSKNTGLATRGWVR